jgi:two-component system alkaline phosphatase synthesis response regulator PhoP
MLKRLLMVDDERDFVFAMKRCLETAGYEVVAAYDGRQALEVVADAANRPDLIILDVIMPPPSGWDVLQAIRADPDTESMPVVMLTSAVDDADKARGWDLGVDWYLTKPFEPRDLLTVIERLLGSPDQEGNVGGVT